MYDLEVEEAHEYFANGILVSNCRYGLKSRLSPGRMPLDQRIAERIKAAAPKDPTGEMILRRKVEEEERRKAQPVQFAPRFPKWRKH